MKNKSIWLINQYLCTPELNGDGHRHSFLAEEFIKKGHDVTLITSSFSHVPYRENKFNGFYKILENNIRTVLVKGNKYSNTQGFSRVLSWMFFCFLLFFIPIKKLPKPDIIIVSSNSLLPILNVVFYFKKKFKKTKFILEIRDIWPLSLIEIGGFSHNNPMIKFLSWVEKLGYRKADHIVSLLMDADDHIKNVLKDKPFKYTWISNGYQIGQTLNCNLKEAIDKQIPKDKFIIGYAGSLGKANAMEYIIHGVKEMKNNDICLCILGSGNDKKKLIKQADNCNRIVFFDKIPKNQVQNFLKKCDLLYFSSKKLSIYEFGISANKTFDYMYAEKPILLSAPTKNNVVELAECGRVVQPEDVEEINRVILEIKNMEKSERQKMGKRGKDYLLNHFTYHKLADKYGHVFYST